ncbi:MAG: glycosyltransferase family 2 protein [Patescibacteria group bacterium]
MAKLSIVVLQYNQSGRTLACLESLRPLNADVIVVDNGSDVEHLKNVEYWLETFKPLNFKLLNSPKNLGYSGGNNIGIKYALEHGAEKILILNNDVVLKEMPSGDADIVGLEQGRVFGFDYLSGAVLLIKKEVFSKIGFFDERYFLYYEDVEFCVRAQKAGFKLSGSTAQFMHATSATTSTLGSANLLYYHTRNALLLNKTHGTWYVRLALPIWSFWIKLKQRIKILLGRNIEESKAILQGARDYDKNRYRMRVG